MTNSFNAESIHVAYHKGLYYVEYKGNVMTFHTFFEAKFFIESNDNTSL